MAKQQKEKFNPVKLMKNNYGEFEKVARKVQKQQKQKKKQVVHKKVDNVDITISRSFVIKDLKVDWLNASQNIILRNNLNIVLQKIEELNKEDWKELMQDLQKLIVN